MGLAQHIVTPRDTKSPSTYNGEFLTAFACKYKKHLAIMQPLYDYFHSFIFKTTCIGASVSIFMSDVQP